MTTDEIEQISQKLERLQIRQDSIQTEVNQLRKRLNDLLDQKTGHKDEYDALDRDGKTIKVGSKVYLVTKGKFQCRYGKVKIVKEWITIKLNSGHETVRKPYNLRVLT